VQTRSRLPLEPSPLALTMDQARRKIAATSEQLRDPTLNELGRASLEAELEADAEYLRYLEITAAD
jgi:hypothetical protein